MTPFELVRERLEKAGSVPRRAGSQWEARCPVHEDRTASLSVKEAPDGKVILKCFADCRTEDVIAALGLEWADLFPGDRKPKAEIVATYDYTDETGQVLYQAVRYFPKDFRRRRPDGAGGWAWSLQGKDGKYLVPPGALPAPRGAGGDRGGPDGLRRRG